MQPLVGLTRVTPVPVTRHLPPVPFTCIRHNSSYDLPESKDQGTQGTPKLTQLVSLGDGIFMGLLSPVLFTPVLCSLNPESHLWVK